MVRFNFFDLPFGLRPALDVLTHRLKARYLTDGSEKPKEWSV